MNKKRVIGLLLATVVAGGIFVGCDEIPQSTDEKQATQTEKLMKEANKKLDMPNIKNFYEKAMMKNVMEACDDSNLITYAYLKNDMTGKFTFLGQAIGYGLPYGTQYTNPQYIAEHYSGSYAILPQVDPNGLYKPSDVNATWLMLIDPTTKKAKPVYVESDLTVTPYKLEKRLLDNSTLPSDY